VKRGRGKARGQNPLFSQAELLGARNPLATQMSILRPLRMRVLARAEEVGLCQWTNLVPKPLAQPWANFKYDGPRECSSF